MAFQNTAEKIKEIAVDTTTTEKTKQLEIGDKLYVFNVFGDYYNEVGVVTRVNKKFAFVGENYKIRRESSRDNGNTFYSVDYKTRYEKENEEILIVNKTKQWYYAIGTIARRIAEKRLNIKRKMKMEQRKSFILKAELLCNKMIEVEEEMKKIAEEIENDII